MTQCLKARNEGRGQKSSDDCHSLDETEKKKSIQSERQSSE